MDAKTALLDVGDRRIDLEGLADRLATLGAQIVLVETAEGPHNEVSSKNRSNPHHNPPIMDAKTALPDVGDRRIDLEGLADSLAALGAQLVELEAAKMRP